MQTPATTVGHLESQIEGLSQQLTRLLDQAGVLQEQLQGLDHRTSFGNDQLGVLIRYLSEVANWADPLDRRLADLVAWAEESREGLAQLEKGIRKLNRTQFKTNSLAEAQQERLQSALETLQDLAARKQEDAERARQQQKEAVEAARREARLAMAADLFPALDGLESALASGRALLTQSREPAAKPGFLTRLAYALGLHNLPATATSGDSQALAAWLDGLELVRERFLALLRAEGIQPIRAEGQPFDPHWHVAVEAVERPDLPPGTVVEELRPGYRLGDRALRYAEVVVTRDEVEVRGWPVEPVASLAEPTLDAARGSQLYETEERPEPAAWDTRPTGEPPWPEFAFGGTDVTEETEEQEVVEIGAKELPDKGPGPVEGPVISASLSADEGAGPVLSEGGGSVLSEGEGPVLSEGEGTRKDRASRDPGGEDERRVDPDIEELIARFEARQRVHRSN